MEDGFFLEGKIKNLEHFYNRGLRMICLNHNVENGIGNPNYGKRDKNGTPDWVTRNKDTGLTDFGFELVDKMNQLGMVIDLSHMSDKGFYDAIKASKKPVITSHSNSNKVHSSLRNLTDDMLYKLADNGGITGLCFAPNFLGKNLTQQNEIIENLILHADHIKNLIGIDHLAFGSDFDGVTLPFDCSVYPSIIHAFEKHGYTTDELEKLTYLNALRVFKENLK
jgi:membrane dipeptidase